MADKPVHPHASRAISWPVTRIRHPPVEQTVVTHTPTTRSRTTATINKAAAPQLLQQRSPRPTPRVMKECHHQPAMCSGLRAVPPQSGSRARTVRETSSSTSAADDERWPDYSNLIYRALPVFPSPIFHCVTLGNYFALRSGS